MAEGSPSGDARTTGSPNIGAIRRGPSFPRDPDAPSLLTTLPAELRLEIYGILFLRDKPVLIKPHPSWFHNTRFLDPSEVFSDVASAQMTQDHEDSSQSSVKLPQISSGIDSGFGLLGSCRQIYTEAIVILYSKNTFTIPYMRFLTRRMDMTVQWMLTLGSNIPLLRRVYICATAADFEELDVFCHIDISRLVRFMWRNPTSELRVLFGLGPSVSETLYERIDRCKYGQPLENLLSTLLKGDPLDIQRYMISKRLVSEIVINNREKEGCIRHFFDPEKSYHGNDIYKNDPSERILFTSSGIYNRFDISSEGRNISWKKAYHRVTFSSLPLKILRKILTYTIFSDNGTSFDLHLKKSSGFHTEALGINHLCREVALKDWFSVNTIILKMSTNQIHTSFSNFAALRHWNREPVSKLLTKGQWTSDKQHRIVLEFHLDGPSTLSILRIKMLRFLQLTLRMRSNVQVVFALTHVNTGEDNIESHVVTLEQLRENVFVLLSKVCDTQDLDLDMPYLDIEFDGRGSPVQICHPEGMSQSGQPYLLENPSVHQQEMKEFARHCRNARRNANHGLRRPYRAPKQAELRQIWLLLKDAIRYY